MSPITNWYIIMLMVFTPLILAIFTILELNPNEIPTNNAAKPPIIEKFLVIKVRLLILE